MTEISLRQIAGRYRESPWLYYYALGKIALDPAYPRAAKILSGSAHPLLDLGCGMGLLAAYLRARGHNAPISGIDVDAGKIEIAQRLLAAEGAAFRAGDALDFGEHSGDVVMLDVLHYFSDGEQELLLKKIALSVAPGGVALIRVALKQSNLRYAVTHLEESFVKLVRWIPTTGRNFPVAEEVKGAFPAAEFESDVRPMWGCTPFNSYLFAFRRKI